MAEERKSWIIKCNNGAVELILQLEGGAHIRVGDDDDFVWLELTREQLLDLSATLHMLLAPGI